MTTAGGRKRKPGFARHLFTPTRQNGRHPHALRKEVVFGVLALVLFAEIGCLSQVLLFSRAPGMTAAVLPAAVADLTNARRTDKALAALETSPLLTQAAQDKANDMAAKGYFAHVAPDGTLPWYWFQQVGYNYQFAGENLAIDFTDSSDVLNAWMNSPMHRENILKQEYTQIGIGIAEGKYQGRETTFVVEFFGTHEPTKVAAAPAPAPAPAPARMTRAASDVHPEVPLETAAAPASGAILGAETQAQTAPHPSLYQSILSSPRTYMRYFLMAVAAFFFALLILAFVRLPHLPHPDALLNGTGLVVAVLGIVILNGAILGSVIVAPPDSQHASAVFAVVR
jgi:hypothetical protein